MRELEQIRDPRVIILELSDFDLHWRLLSTDPEQEPVTS